MAIDITAYLMLEKDSSAEFIGGRNITHILQLDEGHDRPVWQWVKFGSKRLPKTSLVPNSPQSILVDGLHMLAEHLGSDVRVESGLQGFRVSAIVFDDSSAKPQISKLRDLNIKLTLMKPE